MPANEGTLVLDVEDFMPQIVCHLHEPGDHELIINIDKMLYEDRKPSGGQKTDVRDATARANGHHKSIVFLLMHMQFLRTLDLRGNIQRRGMRGLLRRLYNLRHKALRVLIKSAVARHIDPLERLPVLETLHVFVDADSRPFALIQLEFRRALDALDAGRPNQGVARDYGSVCKRE
ncbi:hypothetical protein SDC9_144827 [bioreactor metagenome]|uniref:Uncharacterized protein n=1 Tax=bioreactor metagenome TaxID=1076179 RepID=A0A645E7D2_9ZZZZ